MISTTTRPGNGDIVLGVAGRSTKVVLDTTNKDENKTATQIVADFINAKKWGYNSPNYRVDGNKILISKWAVGQVVGKKGNIVKPIQKMYGFVKILPMPYEKDDQYIFIEKLFRCDTKTRKVEKHNAWFRIKRDKCNSGMYDRFVSDTVSYADSQININQDLCDELEKLGEIESPILGYDTDTSIENLYICEQRGMANIYCLEKDLDLLKFFGYSKSDFKKYDKVALIKEKIEEFLEHIEGGDFYTAPANSLFYWLSKDGVKLNRPYTDKELVEAVRTWMQVNCSESENKVFESQIKKREERAKILRQEYEQLLVEFERLNKERKELGMKELTLSSSKEFTLPGCSWREYKVTPETLDVIRNDINKEREKIEKAELEERLLSELESIIHIRDENGLNFVCRTDWGGFSFQGRDYSLTEETLKMLKEDTEKELEEKEKREQEEKEREREEEKEKVVKPNTNKKKKEEGFDNPFADFFGG